MRGEHVLAFLQEHPWAVTPEKLEQMCAVVERVLAGDVLSEADIQARIGAIDRPTARRAGAVQTIPIFGVIAHRASLFSQASGGTSTQGIAKAVRAALNDPEVGAIVLDVDSPGGSVHGIEELGNEIFASRGTKPIVAVANATAASAAYWLATQADELIVTPSGEVGSIGALAVHNDLSQAADRAGVKRTFISAGKYKTEGNAFEPLNDDARAAMQTRVDAYYDAFVKAVARGRGASQKAVREGYGEGRVLGAARALEAQMVDGVGTLDQVVARLASGKKRVASTLAEGADDIVSFHAERSPIPPAEVDDTRLIDLEQRRRRLMDLT